ncbi:hypothetical protein H5410_005059 [Solanum commersonii]|uniref:Uncharacterized protein n=1 Tax=Solanum commersonii TaxID=4109 RepID=A0A9J6A5M2_SOLCO|nr:hypothetical protein H5410_005059 [Solanum commersonii]
MSTPEKEKDHPSTEGQLHREMWTLNSHLEALVRRAEALDTSVAGGGAGTVDDRVEMMLLMDDPPFTKTFEIYEKVVSKSPNGFAVSVNGVCEITPGVGDGTSFDGWSQEKRGCQRNLEL